MNNKVNVILKLTACDYDTECGANRGCRNGGCTGKISKGITLNEKYFVVDDEIRTKFLLFVTNLNQIYL